MHMLVCIAKAILRSGGTVPHCLNASVRHTHKVRIRCDAGFPSLSFRPFCVQLTGTATEAPKLLGIVCRLADLARFAQIGSTRTTYSTTRNNSN